MKSRIVQTELTVGVKIVVSYVEVGNTETSTKFYLLPINNMVSLKCAKEYEDKSSEVGSKPL